MYVHVGMCTVCVSSKATVDSTHLDRSVVINTARQSISDYYTLYYYTHWLDSKLYTLYRTWKKEGGWRTTHAISMMIHTCIHMYTYVYVSIRKSSQELWTGRKRRPLWLIWQVHFICIDWSESMIDSILTLFALSVCLSIIAFNLAMNQYMIQKMTAF